MKAIPIATFNTLPPAQRLHQRLAQSGFRAELQDDSKLERLWFLSPPRAAFRVDIHPDDYVRVREFIAAADVTEGILREAVRCPECGSSRIEYPQITRKFLMPMAEAVLMAVGLMHRRFYCLDCQYTWPRQKRVRRHLDRLGWPAHSKFWH